MLRLSITHQHVNRFINTDNIDQRNGEWISNNSTSID